MRERLKYHDDREERIRAVIASLTPERIARGIYVGEITREATGRDDRSTRTRATRELRKAGFVNDDGRDNRVRWWFGAVPNPRPPHHKPAEEVAEVFGRAGEVNVLATLARTVARLEGEVIEFRARLAAVEPQPEAASTEPERVSVDAPAAELARVAYRLADELEGLRARLEVVERRAAAARGAA